MANKMLNENGKTTVTTTYFTYDHIAKKIVGTELNFKKSGIPGSEQDEELMARIAEHPNYTFRISKPMKEKNSYKGLNRPLIHDYLDCFGSEEMMEKFQKMKEDGTGFPYIKSWFLDLFPKSMWKRPRRKSGSTGWVRLRQSTRLLRPPPRTALPLPTLPNFPRLPASKKGELTNGADA